MANYGTATARWIAAGSPVRSDGEVQRIFDGACAKCPWLVNGRSAVCGCYVTPPAGEHGIRTAVLGKGLSNKIRMATEDCPDICAVCHRSRWQHLDQTSCKVFVERRGRESVTPRRVQEDPESDMEPPPVSDLWKQRTICVTSYLRPASLELCLRSIERYYPGARVDVEDTGGNLSAGRNRLLARCWTEKLGIQWLIPERFRDYLEGAIRRSQFLMTLQCGKEGTAADV